MGRSWDQLSLQAGPRLNAGLSASQRLRALRILFKGMKGPREWPHCEAVPQTVPRNAMPFFRWCDNRSGQQTRTGGNRNLQGELRKEGTWAVFAVRGRSAGGALPASALPRLGFPAPARSGRGSPSSGTGSRDAVNQGLGRWRWMTKLCGHRHSLGAKRGWEEGALAKEAAKSPAAGPPCRL